MRNRQLGGLSPPPAQQEEEIIGSYRVIRTLGSGTFGRVVLAERLGSGELAAIKLLPRGQYVRSYHTYVAREVLHHASLRHPFVISLDQIVVTQRSLAIVMEYAAGGDLLQHLRSRSLGRLEEREARWMFQQLAIGLEYCHQRGVANRDLKLENLLLDRPCLGTAADWPLLKICDFGYSKHDLNSTAKTGVGTPVYMAPEVIAGAPRYDAKAADIWSAGVILYTLLFGKYPFDSRHPDFARRLLRGQYAVPEGVPASAEALQLLSLMLRVEPAQRIDLPGILRHPFFLQALPEGAAAMNGWYLAHSPDLAWCVPVVGSLIQRATQAGASGEEPVALTLEPLAASSSS